MGTYGKPFAESIGSLDMAAVDAVRATGADEAQVFFHGVWPLVLPQFVRHDLHVWEFNIRDSTMLGLIGAGGLGLLISEAVSLFQWSPQATLLIVVVVLVMVCNALSRRIRKALLLRPPSGSRAPVWRSVPTCCWKCRGLALAHVLEVLDAERGCKRLVFDGDFHWFDADPAAFAIATMHATRSSRATVCISLITVRTAGS